MSGPTFTPEAMPPRPARFGLRRMLPAAAILVGLTLGGSIAGGQSTDPNPSDSGTGSGTAHQGDVNARAARAFVGVAGSQDGFTPLTPCRLFDTRLTSPLNGTRGFYAYGSLSGQGGLAAGCDVPNNATAIQVNLTGISVGGSSGFVRGWAYGETEPNATLLNFSPAINASNMVTLPIANASPTYDYTLKSYGTVNIVGDVVGYFTRPLYVTVANDGSIYDSQSSGVVSVVRLSAGAYRIQFERPVNGCSVATSDFLFSGTRDISADAGFNADDTVDVRVTNTAGVQEDSYFGVLVRC